jgi:hypothetical protein
MVAAALLGFAQRRASVVVAARAPIDCLAISGWRPFARSRLYALLLEILRREAKQVGRDVVTA